MHAFLVHTIPDIPISPDTLAVTPDTSIGIEEIRQIRTFLSKKPIQSSRNTVLIQDAHLLTLPAQNALLKTLEEPPGLSLIYLITSSPDLLLPTILSRVQIVAPPHTSNASHLSDTSYSSDLLTRLLSSPLPKRLEIIEAEEFTRDSALKFLNDLEHILHNQITSPATPPSYGSSREPQARIKRGNEGVLSALISNTRTYLKSNCNLKLVLTDFALKLT